jgi:hypothetical protein
MRKASLTMLCVGAAILGFLGNPDTSAAGVHFGIGIHETVAVAAPARAIVGPGYRVSDVSVRLSFHRGYWYRPFKGHWYRSRWRTGPWGYIAPHRVPRAIVILPPVKHHRAPVHYRGPYGKHRKHWGRW